MFLKNSSASFWKHDTITQMFTIKVIPISRGIGVGELTYFSSVDYPVGSFVEVPVRNKDKTAMVISSEEVQNVKAKIRSGSYALKKIKKQKSKQIITQEYLNAIKKTAKYHSATVGSVLFASIPKVLFDGLEVSNGIKNNKKPKLRSFIIPRVFQGLSQSRVEFYRTSIRETFAVGGSVFITTPTIADAERVYKELVGGIEKYSFLLHSLLGKKIQKERVTELLSSEHPVLIVATQGFLAVPRNDLATIIVEKESSHIYRARTRPFIDGRVLIHNFASELGGQLFLADLPLSIESVYRRDIGDYEEIVTGDHRMHFPTRAEIINLQGVATSPKKKFNAISTDLFEYIEHTSENSGRTFLYVARRGLSPITLCRDCGTVVTCDECGASVVLHKGTEENHFLCHSCGALRHAREVCKSCKSWRLEAYGIGVELVERELQRTFPGRSVFVLSSDTAKSHSAIKKTIKEFYSTSKAILVGTEMALPYLGKHIPLVGVVSLDSLLSLATWNIYERIASTITRLREISGELLLLQTRMPEADVLRKVISGNFSGFYKNELKIRKALGYPPYTTIIKVSVTGKEKEVKKKMEMAVNAFLPYDLVIFSRMLRAPKGKFTLHGFLRVGREEWPDKELLERLYSLSPSYIISVNPDSIL